MRGCYSPCLGGSCARSGEFFYSDIKDSYPSLKRWAAIDWETSEVTHFEVPGDELQDAPNVFDRWLAFDPDSPWRLAESARDFLTEETGARFTHAGAEVDYMGYGPDVPVHRRTVLLTFLACGPTHP